MVQRVIRPLVFLLVVAAAVAAVLWQTRWRPVPVEAAEARVQSVLVETMGTGTLEARISSIVSSKITGRIVDLAADQGDWVEADQIIVRLDDVDLQRQVELASANVEVQAAALDRLQSDRARAEAVQRQARLEYERAMAAYEHGGATALERDRALEQLEISNAEFTRSEGAITEARAAHVSSQRILDYHRAQLDDTVIRSPVTGLVVRRDRERGDIVAPGSSILRVIETETLWVSAWVDETEMARVELDQPARVVFRAEPRHDRQGHVARLGREVDPELREYLVDVAVDELPPSWAVGQRAEVFIMTDVAEEAIAIPAEFLMVRDGTEGVWIAEGGRAAWRPCEIGLRGCDMIQVVSNLEAGQTVIRPVSEAAKRMLRVGRRVQMP